MKVLIIDDDKSIQSFLYDFFKGYGALDIDVANDGAEGLIMASKNNYSLISIDYDMPYLSGTEVLNKFRESSKNATTPVIFLSGNINQAVDCSLKESKELDKDALFLSKPIDIDRLYRYVNLILK